MVFLETLEFTLVNSLVVYGVFNVTIPVYRVYLEILLNGTTFPAIPAYCPNEALNATNVLKNAGTINVTGNLSSKILDSAGIELINQIQSNIDLAIDETKSYELDYTVKNTDNSGIAIAESNFTYGNYYTYLARQFRINKGIGNFLYRPINIEKWIRPGGYDTETIYLWLEDNCENATVIMNKSTDIPGDWVNFTREEVLLPRESPTNQTIANITVPITTSPGDYTGTIYANADGTQGTINLIVHVRGFSLNVTIPPEYKQICPGNSIPAIVEIEKNQPGFVDINMSYQILNSNWTIIAELNKTLSINMSLVDIPTLTIPSSANDGYYIFLATLIYNETEIWASDNFQVMPAAYCIPTTIPPKGPRPGPTPPIYLYALDLRLSTNTLTVIIGNRTSFIAFVNNTGTATVKSVKISIEGVPLDWLNILPLESDILPAETKEYLITISIPNDAEPGIYNLSVKAKDGVESETRNLILIIGRNPKEIADLLLKTLDGVKKIAKDSLFVEDCVEITLIQSSFNDAEVAYQNGIKEYENGNYFNAVNWLEYALSVHQQIIERVDIALQVEIESTNRSKIVIPPGFNSEEQFNQAEIYFSEKDYEKICDPIIKIRNLIMMGIVFWSVAAIISIILIMLLLLLYKKKREREKVRILKEVKKRLEVENE